VAYTVDIRAFVGHETVMLTERKLITGHELSGAAMTKGRQISNNSSTSSTAGCYRSYMLLFVTTTNLLADRFLGFTLSQATKALRESRGIALLYF